MIGFIQGEVLTSDGEEALVLTSSGIGYQMVCQFPLLPGSEVAIYISEITREFGRTLYAFKDNQEKKIFELLLKVKGVGPKSSYNLVQCLGPQQVQTAIRLGDKKLLQTIQGIGAKAAAQIVLDLKEKIKKFDAGPSMQAPKTKKKSSRAKGKKNKPVREEQLDITLNHQVLSEALMACQELGFNDDDILPMAHELLAKHSVKGPEQLVELLLKEMH